MNGLRSKLSSIIDSREPFEWFTQLLSAVLLGCLLWLCRSFLELFGSGGAIRQEIFFDVSKEAPFSAWTLIRTFHLGAHQDLILKIAYVAAIISTCLAFFRPRDWRCVFALFATFVFIKSTMMGAVYGMYEFIHIGLFYCMIWSLTTGRWLARQLPEPDRSARLVGFAFQLHLASAYCFSGFSKGIGRQWQTGEALWRSIYRSDSAGTRIFDFSFLFHWPIVLQISCLLVVTFEALYPLALSRKFRGVMTGMLILMHFGIMLVFGLWLFGATMIILNLFFFAQGRRLDQRKDEDGSLLKAIGLGPIEVLTTES